MKAQILWNTQMIDVEKDKNHFGFVAELDEAMELKSKIF